MKQMAKITALVVSGVLFGVFVVYATALVQYSLEHRTRGESAANMRSIIAGAVEEAEQRNGEFPMTDAGWAEALVSGGFVRDNAFIHPKGDPYGYILVPGGRDDFSPDHILVYENPDANPSYTLIGYADGHVDLVEQSAALRIITGLTSRPQEEDITP